MLAASMRLGPYEIVAPLGAGGMGEVYRARDTRLGREVAIKVLPEPFAGNADRLARFEREARAVAALSHPNILAIHDYGTHGAVTYAVMELLEGETLRSRLAEGPLPWRKAVELGVAIAEGLSAAHVKGIIHRDLKPENLFLTADGRVKVLDFGLARLQALPTSQAETGPYVRADTEPGTVMGTVGYMSPEQVKGQPADVPSDLFSLGCVLYEMVTGRRAFARETAAETMTAILHDEPPELSASARPIPPEVERVIRHCLEKNREERFQTSRDLAFALRAVLTDSSVTSLERQRPETRPLKPHKLWLAAALVLLGLAGAPLYWFHRDGKTGDAGPRVPAAQPVDSLAVLPFVNDGGDPEAGFLSDGLCITLGNNLLQVRSLKVRPYSSVARYRGKDTDAVAAGHALQVQVVLTGTVRKQGNKLLINVELVDVRDNHKIWGELYSREFGDLLAVQTEIARDVTAKLRLTLTAEEQRQLAKRPTENPEAYRLYVLGRVEWNKRTFEGLTKGIDYFHRAIKTDRDYALAYSGLADCYTVLNASSHLPSKEACPKALEALTTALKLDNTLAEAHAALGLLKTHYEWDWRGAERAFQRAIELNPNYATAHHWYCVYLYCMGQHDQALAEAKLAHALDPDSLIIDCRVGTQLVSTGQTDRAIDHFRKVLERDKNYYPTHLELGSAYMVKEMYQEAVVEFQEARRLEDNLITTSNLGRAYAAHGEQEKAREVLALLKERVRSKGFTPAIMASIHAALGEDDRALELLERGYEDRWCLMSELRVEPAWTSLRSHPRFAQLVQDMALPR